MRAFFVIGNIVCLSISLVAIVVSARALSHIEASPPAIADLPVTMEEYEARKPKFHYLQEVAIVGGFFRGHTAVVKDWHRYQNDYSVEITDFAEDEERPYHGNLLHVAENDLADWAVVNVKTREVIRHSDP